MLSGPKSSPRHYHLSGPLTRAAIRRFQQQDIESDATGHLTADQANRLVAP
jgi:hypothetical protein